MLARVVTHVLACAVKHVLVWYPMVQARVLQHVLARVVTNVLARVIMHVHDYYLKTCLQDLIIWSILSESATKEFSIGGTFVAI